MDNKTNTLNKILEFLVSLPGNNYGTERLFPLFFKDNQYIGKNLHYVSLYFSNKIYTLNIFEMFDKLVNKLPNLLN